MAETARILGIDPGSRVTGFALASFEGQKVTELEWGVWRPGSGGGRAESLAELSLQVETWLEVRECDAAAVESLFHHKNARSLLVLSEARGVLLASLGRRGIPVREYPPATIKKTICGSGAASKEQVQRALFRTVPGLARYAGERVPADASDALAMAVCHHVHARHASRFGGTTR